jgi:hypothetical protein
MCMDIVNYDLREKYDQLKRFGDLQNRFTPGQ